MPSIFGQSELIAALIGWFLASITSIFLYFTASARDAKVKRSDRGSIVCEKAFQSIQDARIAIAWVQTFAKECSSTIDHLENFGKLEDDMIERITSSSNEEYIKIISNMVTERARASAHCLDDVRDIFDPLIYLSWYIVCECGRATGLWKSFFSTKISVDPGKNYIKPHKEYVKGNSKSAKADMIYKNVVEACEHYDRLSSYSQVAVGMRMRELIKYSTKSPLAYFVSCFCPDPEKVSFGTGSVSR